jgi:hypothetical protein
MARLRKNFSPKQRARYEFLTKEHITLLMKFDEADEAAREAISRRLHVVTSEMAKLM